MALPFYIAQFNLTSTVYLGVGIESDEEIGEILTVYQVILFLRNGFMLFLEPNLTCYKTERQVRSMMQLIFIHYISP